jgi:hypothetical protein
MPGTVGTSFTTFIFTSRKDVIFISPLLLVSDDLNEVANDPSLSDVLVTLDGGL